MTGDASPEPTGLPREPLHERLRRIMGPQLILVVVLIALPLLRLGARDTTTSPTLEGLVPRDARLLAQQTLGDVHALLIESEDVFQLLMAYRTDDDWVALHVPQPTSGAEYAVDQGLGNARVPAFTAAYGRLRGQLPGATTKVRVGWNDGPRDVPLIDGAFLGVREGRFSVDRVSLLDPAGNPVRDLLRSRS